MEPLVSIIVPAYNHDRFIKECLMSISNQTYVNKELILINDGSTDNTDKIVKEMYYFLNEQFTRFIYINKKNGGVCRCLNMGIDVSQGRYIVPFASDDFMLPLKLEHQIKYMEANKDYIMTYTDCYSVTCYGELKYIKEFNVEDRFSNYIDFKEGYIFDFMLKNLLKMPSTTLCYKRECFDKIGKFDDNTTCEDPDMLLRVAKDYKIGCIKEILSLHRVHNTNAGIRKEIILPMIEDMKEKYINSDILTAEQKIVLYSVLNNFLAENPLS